MHRRFVCTLGLVAAAGLLVAATPPRAATLSRRAAPEKTKPVSTEAITYEVDPAHSTALFRVVHLGAGPFYGRFNELSGKMSFADGSDSDLELDVAIAINSVDTGVESLDQHLKSPDFFGANDFPKMTFKSVAAKKVGEQRYEVEGDLTIRDVTQRITAKVEHTGTASMGRGERCGFEAHFTVKRTEFGVMYGVEQGMLGDRTKIIVALEGVRPRAGEGEERPGADDADGADEADTGLPGPMAQFDANGDGMIQKDEAPERMQAIFDRIDANGDGALDADEIRAMMDRRRGGNDGG